MGVNYVDTIPFNNVTGQAIGAGRPSIRIASKQAFTHGLFIGDFAHIPAGICGTWPACESFLSSLKSKADERKSGRWDRTGHTPARLISWKELIRTRTTL